MFSDCVSFVCYSLWPLSYVIMTNCGFHVGSKVAVCLFADVSHLSPHLLDILDDGPLFPVHS